MSARYVVIVLSPESTIVVDTVAGTAQEAGSYDGALPPLLEMVWATIAWYISSPTAGFLPVSRQFMQALLDQSEEALAREGELLARQAEATLDCLDLRRAVRTQLPAQAPA